MGHSNESSYEKEIKKYEIPSFLQNFYEWMLLYHDCDQRYGLECQPYKDCPDTPSVNGDRGHVSRPVPVLEKPKGCFSNPQKHLKALSSFIWSYWYYSSIAWDKCMKSTYAFEYSPCYLSLQYVIFSGGIYAIIYHALAEKPGGNVALSLWPPRSEWQKENTWEFHTALAPQIRISNKEANVISTKRKETLSLFQSCWETCLCFGRGSIDSLLQSLLFDIAHVSKEHDKQKLHSARS